MVKKWWQIVKVPNTVFLNICIIHHYIQTTGSWAAKIGKMQVQLKRIRFWYVLWGQVRCHGNTAGYKQALNTEFDLFLENPVIRFFPPFVSRKLRKILAYWHWSHEILTERSSVIWCFVQKISLSKFHETSVNI